MTAIQQCSRCSGAIPAECHSVTSPVADARGITRESRTFCEFCGMIRYALWVREHGDWRLDFILDYFRRTEPESFDRELAALESLVAA